MSKISVIAPIYGVEKFLINEGEKDYCLQIMNKSAVNTLFFRWRRPMILFLQGIQKEINV